MRPPLASLLLVVVLSCTWKKSISMPSIQDMASLEDQLKEVLSDFGASQDTSSLVDLISQYAATDDINDLPAGTQACQSCQVAIPMLRRKIGDKTFEDVELQELLKQLCISTVVQKRGTSFKNETFCNGVIDLYGPHVIPIITNKGIRPRSICENLNLCFHQPSHPATNGIPPKPDSAGEIEFLRHVIERSRLKRSTENTGVIRIAQVTDIHIDSMYHNGSATDCGLPTCCHQEDTGNGSAWQFGTWNCNIPQGTVDALFNQVAAMTPAVDFVIYTGDNPPHQMWMNETQEKQFKCTDNIVRTLKNAFSDFNVFSVMGNHDPFPTNLYYLGQDEFQLNPSFELNEKYAELWPQLANISTDQLTNILAGAYYTSPTGIPGLRIVVVNTNFWYTFNWYTVLAEDSAPLLNQMAFLENTLTRARLHGEKVIMALHHPIGSNDILTRYSQWYSGLITRFHDVIVLQMAGHTHDDHFKVFTDDNDDPISALFVAPAVTSYTEAGGVNPSVRIYELDRDSLQLRDYEQHRMYLTPDLTEMPDLQKAYNAKSLYGLPDMSPKSLSSLIGRIYKDDAAYNTFAKHFETEAGRHACDEDCKRERICELRYTSFDQVYACRVGDLDPAPKAQPEEGGGNGSSTTTYAASLMMAVLFVTSILS